VPYYTFKLASSKKSVLTKQFTTQDCIDLHFLLANKDIQGVDAFCEKKFVEYTGESVSLNCLDKFLYLFSQKILSHSFFTTVVHSTKVNGENKKTPRKVNLVNIYNSISDAEFKQKDVFEQGDLRIEYGIPVNLSDSKLFNFYSVQVGNIKNSKINEFDCSSMSFLPLRLYRDILEMQTNNSKIIKSEYFEKNFLTELEFNNSSFLFILDFIYSENVGDFYTLSFTMCKDHNISFEHIKSVTMRELYLLVDTINKDVQEKKQKQKSNERAI
jgi:hypothetical protein